MSNVGCILGVPRAAKKKSVHAAHVGLAFAPTLDIGGKGRQAFVIDSCPADFFFADPGPGVKGLGIILWRWFSLLYCLVWGAGYITYDLGLMIWGASRAWLS